MERERRLARVLAYTAGRSLPMRGTTTLNKNHPSPGGVVVIRGSGDQRLQAVAFGRLGESPVVVALLDPLAPHHPGLERLGAFLDLLLRAPHGAQLWVPDRPSWTALAIEGQRSAHNPHVSPARQQLGGCLQALHRLEPLAGQQVVAIATEVLAQHLVTGQSPTEDLNLGARLAWDHPSPGHPPAQIAALRLHHHPGPSLLTVAEDNRVELLRLRFRRGRDRPRDEAEMERILTRAALESWELLTQARAVFQRLPLAPLPGLAVLEVASHRELERLRTGVPGFTNHLGRACGELEKREHWRARLEDLEARGDPIIREVRRKEGRVIAGTVLRIRNPWLILATTQPVLRLRPGTRLTTADARIEVVVETVRPQPIRTLLLVRVTRGVRALVQLTPGQTVDWCDTVVFAGTPAGRHVTHLPDLPPAQPLPPLSVPDDLLGFAHSLHQP